MAVSVTSPTPERAPISFRASLGIVLLFLFFGLFVLVLIAATPHGNNYEAKRAEAREKKLSDARKAAAQELNSYAWVDKGKGIARIPIDRAMELTLRDLASKKPAPANPIETPATAQAPAPAPASGHHPPRRFRPRRHLREHRNRRQLRARIPKIGISRPRRGNPPGAIPGTQPGPGATPAATPGGQPALPPMPEQKPPGTPIPVAGKTPP